MPVAEAQERISEAEFQEWRIWLKLRQEIQERIAKGLPPVPVDGAETMSAEETVEYVRTLAAQMNAQFTKG